MKQETLEEVADNSLYSMEYLNESERVVFKKGCVYGAKRQQERSYSDMQEYAIFCIECDRKEMPLLLVEDWYKQFKKQIK